MVGVVVFGGLVGTDAGADAGADGGVGWNVEFRLWPLVAFTNNAVS